MQKIHETSGLSDRVQSLLYYGTRVNRVMQSSCFASLVESLDLGTNLASHVKHLIDRQRGVYHKGIAI